MADDRPRRRWLSLSLRTMLIGIVAVALWLGSWVTKARDQRAAVEAVDSAPYFANVLYKEDFDEAAGRGGAGKRTWVPAALEAWLGKDYFHDVSGIAFSRNGPPDPAADREIFRKIAGVRSLDQLNPNVEVRDADVGHIAGLPNLKRLSLRAESPGFSDGGLRRLAGMPRLEALEVHSAPVTDAGLAALKETRTLRSLLLGQAKPFSPGGNLIAVTGDGFAHLASLPALEDLELHSASLTGDGLRNVGSLRHLKRLRLEGAAITDEHLRFLAPLTGLESLEIVGSGIDGTGFRHLSGLSRVAYVCVEGPNVTDAAIPFLARLPSLESVMIYGTRVTAEGLEGFRAAPHLKQMGLTPAVPGDTKRLKQALPGCIVINDGKVL